MGNIIFRQRRRHRIINAAMASSAPNLSDLSDRKEEYGYRVNSLNSSDLTYELIMYAKQNSEEANWKINILLSRSPNLENHVDHAFFVLY